MNDACFKREKDIPMTKEEIRYISLGYLDLSSARNLLDIGSGSGSISIEAAVMNRHLQVTGIECDRDAYELSLVNIGIFNKELDLESRVRFLHDKAPSEKIMESYDRIFIGGTKGNPKQVIEWAHDRLNDHGILVMNFIALENFQRAMEAIHQKEGLSKIEGAMCSINKLSDLGPYTYLKPHNPAFIIKTVKQPITNS